MTGSSLRLAVLGSAAAIAVVGISASAGAEMLQSVGKGEGEVAIVAWPGYIENGSTDKNYDWVTGFEAATGCKVTVKTAGSSDEMVSLMNGGGFDLVTASGDASLRLIAGGTVQEVNTALIPSWSTVDERLQSGAWHTVGGKHYGVPYQWGPNVLMYNTEVFKDAPKSWNVVFEEQNLPDGKSNKGRVQAYYGPIYIADAALYLKAHKPELGITDPYALTQEQFDAAVDSAARAAADRAEVLERRHRADRGLQERRRGRRDILAVPGQPAAWAKASRSPAPCRRKAPPDGRIPR